MIPKLSLVDETYDTSITLSYFLSIQVCLDGFSFSTLDPVRNKYIQFKYFSFEKATENDLPDISEKIFEQNELLNLPYKKVFVLNPTRFATLVPTGVFKPEEAEKWLNFTHEVPPGYTTLHAQMKLSDAWNIFAIHEKIKELFLRQFPDPVFLHQYIPMTETRLAVSRPGTSRSMVIINLQQKHFDLAVLEKNNLKLCNSYEINGENDLLYFTLLVFDQLQIIPASTEVLVTGKHPQKEVIIGNLKKYIKHVKQPGLPGGFQYSYLFKDVAGDQFQNLLSLPSCV